MISKTCQTIFLICALFFVFYSRSDDEDDTNSPTATPALTQTPTAMPTLTPTPGIWIKEKIEFYLSPKEDGLYCHGHKYRDEDEIIYDEKKFWLPSQFTEGETFNSFLFSSQEEVYIITATNAAIQIPGHIFNGVINFEHVGNSFTYMSFMPDYGLLWYRFGTSVGHSEQSYTLEEISLSETSDSFSDYYALAVGNRWYFSVAGSQNGRPASGEQTTTITGRKLVGQTETYIYEIDRIIYFDV